MSERAPEQRTPRALTIAGSDSGGGAGIQADLKAFARCGVHGTSAITAITAQNTVGVSAIHLVPAAIVLAQVRAVLDDIGVDAVKVGMIGSREVAVAVAEALDALPAGTPVVVDPVMVAESGARLGDGDAVAALVEEVLPRASVVTPNLPEARVLASIASGGSSDLGAGESEGRRGLSSGSRELSGGSSGLPGDREAGELDEAAAGEELSLMRAILGLGADAVLVTGGHRDAAVDLLLRSGVDETPIELPGPRHRVRAAHGSGCTHSSALAAALALGHELPDAARIARQVAGEAVRDGLVDIGAGPGPVDALRISSRR
jgi:hydroxymethylpyrimidine/phosphomethylpyrimidine kinase